mmetsp:Transcript_36706/g.98429  ORF Transcript_36706/g.98429 Transcript_36706/m.98429 type:complete len:269 (-) Transcript_36706:1625-2431(-)
MVCRVRSTFSSVETGGASRLFMSMCSESYSSATSILLKEEVLIALDELKCFCSGVARAKGWRPRKAFHSLSPPATCSRAYFCAAGNVGGTGPKASGRPERTVTATSSCTAWPSRLSRSAWISMSKSPCVKPSTPTLRFEILRELETRRNELLLESELTLPLLDRAAASPRCTSVSPSPVGTSACGESGSLDCLLSAMVWPSTSGRSAISRSKTCQTATRILGTISSDTDGAAAALVSPFFSSSTPGAPEPHRDSRTVVFAAASLGASS